MTTTLCGAAVPKALASGEPKLRTATRAPCWAENMKPSRGRQPGAAFWRALPALLLAALLSASGGLLTILAADDVPLLIKGGTVVNADQKFEADVVVENGRIAAVGKGLQAPKGGRVIDATGKYVMPGGIDPHTHLEMPFMGQEACDDFFSGQAAALAGGTTMHIDFALPAGPTGKSLMAGFEKWMEKSAKSCMDYGFHMAVTSWSPEVAEDMGKLVALGINSFKFFLAYKGALMVSDEEFVAGLSRCKELGALTQVHCENGDAVAAGQARIFDSGITGPEFWREKRLHAQYAWPSGCPPVSSDSCLCIGARLSKTGKSTGKRVTEKHKHRWVNTPIYIVHVMSIDAMEEVALARKNGQRVIGEPVVSGLSQDESKLWDPDFKVAAQYVMSPPIRSAEHRVALKKALASGVLQIVATDHAVFNSTQKAVGKNDFRVIPNGVNGIEERMHVTWNEMVVSGLMSVSDFVRSTSTAAAQAFNLYPQKGVIAAGSDADIILLDPTAEHTISAATHHSRMDTNIYEGMKIRGKVVTTISRGRVVWENGKLHVSPGTGRYLAMKPFGPMFDGLGELDETLMAEATRYGPTPVDRSDSAFKDEL